MECKRQVHNRGISVPLCRCAVSTGDEDKRSETNCQLWLTALRQDHQALTSITDGTKTRFIVPDGALFFLSY
jgi:hypothetical protein